MRTGSGGGVSPPGTGLPKGCRLMVVALGGILALLAFLAWIAVDSAAHGRDPMPVVLGVAAVSTLGLVLTEARRRARGRRVGLQGAPGTANSALTWPASEVAGAVEPPDGDASWIVPQEPVTWAAGREASAPRYPAVRIPHPSIAPTVLGLTAAVVFGAICWAGTGSGTWSDEQTVGILAVAGVAAIVPLLIAGWLCGLRSADPVVMLAGLATGIAVGTAVIVGAFALTSDPEGEVAPYLMIGQLVILAALGLVAFVVGLVVQWVAAWLRND